jgi:hypothetical protein
LSCMNVPFRSEGSTDGGMLSEGDAGLSVACQRRGAVYAQTQIFLEAVPLLGDNLMFLIKKRRA